MSRERFVPEEWSRRWLEYLRASSPYEGGRGERGSGRIRMTWRRRIAVAWRMSRWPLVVEAISGRHECDNEEDW